MVKSLFKYKYKDNKPKNTIKNIKNFFHSLNFNIKIVDEQKTEIGTYFCRIELYKNNIFILSANGKVTTKDYCLASGLGELYERFCNKISLFSNFFINNKLKDLAQQRKYFFAKDEKPIEKNNLLPFLNFQDFFNDIFNNDENLIQNILDLMTYGYPIGLPFINIQNSKDLKYLDVRILEKINGSIGMAAGNTIEEALCQGLSEIYEKYVAQEFYLQNFDCYYALNLKSIKNNEIQKIISKIEQLGFKLIILDLSYNFNMPVLMSLLCDPCGKNIITNFGAFPVFDIALERIFTELYQGIPSYQDYFINKMQYPFYDENPYRVLQTGASSIGDLKFFPENIFNKIKYINCFNSKIFIKNSRQITNKYLLNSYFYNLNNLHNLNFYYRDFSLMKKVKAVHIVCDNLNISKYKHIPYKNTSILLKPFLIDAYRQALYLNMNLIDENKNEEDIFSIINNYKNIKLDEDYLKHISILNDLLWTDPFNPLDGKNMFIENIIFNLNNILFFNESIFSGFEYTIFHPYLKKYIILIKYIFSKNYTNEEIKIFFKSAFNDDIHQEDFIKWNNTKYLLNEIYLKPLRAFYKSQDYENIVTAFFP